MIVINGENAAIKLIAFVLLIISAAYNKVGSSDQSKLKREGTIEGTWKMSEVRADPGNGSGKFIPTNLDVTVIFEANGYYSDSRDEVFNRYVSIAADTVKLFNSETSLSKLIAIKELNGNTLMYFTNWPWCGGPYGEKFARINKVIH